MDTSSGSPGAHSHGTELDGPIDPELAIATYALEPGVLTPLLTRIASSRTAGEHRSVLPFTGAPLASIPLSTPQDVADAVARARQAQRTWAERPVAERAAVLGRFARLVLERRSEILDLIQMETGKSRGSAFEEVADVAHLARHYAVRGASYLADRRVRGMLPVLTRTSVHRRPVGVVGVIAPWNYPLTLALAEAAPAFVAGNAVVLKPDPQTTLTALWAAEALEECGLPPGLLEVVAGGGEVGSALVDTVDHIAFTGSTATGRIIGARAGQRLIGATLELGGKNPLYVAADAPLPAAVAGAVRACFANTGQLCMSIERLILHESIADDFLADFLPRVRALRLGTGLNYTADIGSLTSQAQLERVLTHVDDALARGARVLAGGVHRADIGPYFYAPTVLDEVPPDALVAREETFGPVVSVQRVASDEEAVAAMNDTEYGLNASIWTGNTGRGRALAARVEAGSVNVNEGYTATFASMAAPMGGMKASGLGRRHGRESIEALTEVQTIAVQRGASFGLTMDRLYELGGETSSKVLSGALEAMRRWGMP